MTRATHRRPDQLTVFDAVGGHAALTFQVYTNVSSYVKEHWTAHASAFIGIVVNYVELHEQAWVSQQLNESGRLLFASNLTISQYRLRMWGPCFNSTTRRASFPTTCFVAGLGPSFVASALLSEQARL